MSIVWKDIFKPRYALVIEQASSFFNSKPVIMRVPFKRPLSMSYRDFHNKMYLHFGKTCMIIYGHMFVLRNVEGLGGSVLEHNVQNSISVEEL